MATKKKKQTAAKKAPPKKPVVKKAPGKAVKKKPAASKTSGKKLAAIKTPAKTVAKKNTAKKPAAKAALPKKKASTPKKPSLLKTGAKAAAVVGAVGAAAAVAVTLATTATRASKPQTSPDERDTREPTPSIAVGAPVPTITLQDQGGHEIDLGERLLSSPWTVLYFYPKDDTPGCTKEACSFRDSINNLQIDGLQVIGVSPDSPEDHRKFIEKYGLNFTLLSDPEKKLIGYFNLWQKKKFMGREYMGVERTTLLVHGDVVASVWPSVSVEGHVEAVLSKLEELRA